MRSIHVSVFLCDAFSNMVLACLLEPLRVVRDQTGADIRWNILTDGDRAVSSSSGLSVSPEMPIAGRARPIWSSSSVATPFATPKEANARAQSWPADAGRNGDCRRYRRLGSGAGRFPERSEGHVALAASRGIRRGVSQGRGPSRSPCAGWSFLDMRQRCGRLLI